MLLALFHVSKGGVIFSFHLLNLLYNQKCVYVKSFNNNDCECIQYVYTIFFKYNICNTICKERKRESEQRG